MTERKARAKTKARAKADAGISHCGEKNAPSIEMTELRRR
jgi:hypothetical protein